MLQAKQQKIYFCCCSSSKILLASSETKITIVFFLCFSPGENMGIDYFLTVTLPAETSLDLKEITEI